MNQSRDNDGEKRLPTSATPPKPLTNSTYSDQPNSIQLEITGNINKAISIVNTIDTSPYIKVIGPIPESPRMCIVTWARKPPKAVFRDMVKLAQNTHPQKLHPTIYIDDICSLLDPANSQEQQTVRNDAYRDFFIALGCEVHFSSELYKSDNIVSMLRHLHTIGRAFPPEKFLKFLPRQKREMPDLPIDEYYHMLFELWLMNEAGKTNNCLVTGAFSELMVHAHRQTSKTPMTGLILPKLG